MSGKGIFETQVVSCLAFESHTLIKVCLKIDVDVEQFLETLEQAVLHSTDNDSDCELADIEDQFIQHHVIAKFRGHAAQFQ